MVENYSAEVRNSPQDVLAQARTMIQAQGAPMTTDNLNRAMLAMSQGRDEDFGAKLAERAVVQGNRNVPRAAAAARPAPPSGPPAPSSTEPQSRGAATASQDAPTQLVGAATTGGTMEGPIDPETYTQLTNPRNQGLPGGSVAPHMAGIPGSPVSVQDYIADMVGEPPANPGAPTTVAGPVGPAVTGGTMDDVPNVPGIPQYAGPGVPGAPPSVPQPSVGPEELERLQAVDQPLGHPVSPLDAVGGGAALMRALVGRGVRNSVGGPEPYPNLGVTVNPQGAGGPTAQVAGAPNRMLYAPYDRYPGGGPSIVPPGPALPPPGPPSLPGPNGGAIPLPGARTPTMIEPPPPTARVGGRVEGSQPRIGKGRLDNAQEISQREINRTVSRNLRERYDRGQGARTQPRANARSRTGTGGD